MGYNESYNENCDKLSNLDSREGFVGFDSLNEFDNPVVRDEYHNWLDSHYNEVDEDLFPNDDDFDDDYNPSDEGDLYGWDENDGQHDCENDY